MVDYPRTTALIVAAGKGVRAGGHVPKQFAPLAGKPMVAWSVEAFASHPDIHAIYVVVGEGQQASLASAVDTSQVTSVIGGSERVDSVRAGLEAIAAGGGTDHVLIHDAARPFLSHMVIDSLLSALETHVGALPALGSVDTLAAFSDGSDGLLGDVVDRTKLVRVQTPQAFHFDAILNAHRNYAEHRLAAPPPTDDAQMARAAGYDVALIAGDTALEKITLPEDFARAEAMRADQRISRTAMGFDVHRLEDGEELWLGGVRVPFDKGLSGHSDADVALHALTDALLGTICSGDIGSHFPPSDPQWRGAASHQFVEHARDLIAAKGGIIDHVDLTIICEAPKIGPHRDAMRAKIATMLKIDVDHVSVKATTTERLGLTGRGEGIAAQAIATIRV
jgi:2-C-methyl-D-erythritol 4-phosphate cytidylyltransferase/2-C-methyl-D-erythritol 2,4-cyclodiphosphate synthase